MQTTAKTPNIQKINEIIRGSKDADSRVASEQRSNVLIFSSEHYSKRVGDVLSNARTPISVSKEAKIRLTKNHVRRIINFHINNSVSSAPSCLASPNNESELQDIKSAELHNAIIQYARKKYNLEAKHIYQAQDFFIQGEVAVKITWNPDKGVLKGYLPAIGEDGEEELDEYGRQVAGEEPVFSGDLDFERIWSWNIIRDKDAETLEDSQVLGFTKLAKVRDLKERYENDESKLKFVQESSSDIIRVFDPGNGAYADSKGMVEIRELYWKPSKMFPTGWYSISTREGILEEDELPFGLYPILVGGCIDQPSSARCRSIIKDLRPYQIEINRASSKQAEHQITLGDDKLILPNGSSIEQAGNLPGIRAFKTTGAAPVVMGGRSGAQYVEYISGQVEEMYAIGMAKELIQEKPDNSQDPYNNMFKSLRQKKEFSLFSSKLESFYTKQYELILETLRRYMPDDEIIQAIGKSEQINIGEFKNSNDLGYQIKLSPISDDLNTQMGKQLAFNHLIQYVGPNLSRNDIGKIVTEMPFLSEGKRIFSDLVIDEENATNLILQLDRGQTPGVSPGLNKNYTLSRLTSRTNKSDFQFLPDNIQENYAKFVFSINQAITVELQNTKALEADFIPANGFLTPCDFYVPDPSNPSKTHRARLPIDALGWLVKRLEEQGNSLGQLEQMQASAKGNLAGQAMSTNDGISSEQDIGQDPSLQGGGNNGTSQTGSQY